MLEKLMSVSRYKRMTLRGMIVLLRLQDGKTRFDKLWYKIGFGKASLSRVIDMLSIEGLVRRERDLDDLRLTWVELTDSGMKLVKELLL